MVPILKPHDSFFCQKAQKVRKSFNKKSVEPQGTMQDMWCPRGIWEEEVLSKEEHEVLNTNTIFQSSNLGEIEPGGAGLEGGGS